MTSSSGMTPGPVGATTAAPVYTRNATGLVREIRLFDQIAYNIGAVTPLSSGLILLYFAVFVFPQTNLFLALLIPAVALSPSGSLLLSSQPPCPKWVATTFSTPAFCTQPSGSA